MDRCVLCGREGYHYCSKLDIYVEAGNVNYEVRTRTHKDHTGAVAGTIGGALLGGPVGAIAGFLLGDSLDD